jgi:hypothetical protein
MAFSGYLVKVGSYTIPLHFITFETYKCTPDQRQDVDSYRDLNQDLHRNVSSHYKSIVTFETLRNLHETSIRALFSGIQSNYTIPKERKVKLHYWNPEKGNYDSGDFYFVQPDFTIRKVIDDDSNKDIIYDSLTIKFIEY